MTSSTQIRVNVLRSSPQVLVDDAPIRMVGRPLELFVYLAVENVREYSRTILTQRLFGTSDPDAVLKRKFRTHALGNIDDTIKDLCLNDTDEHKVVYNDEHVSVDALEFEEQAQQFIRQGTFLADAAPVKQILDLYQTPFLVSYRPAFDFIEDWRNEKQTYLAELRKGLLEKLVQYYILRRSYGPALLHAQEWYDSNVDDDPDEQSIHYLIWLYYNMRHTALMQGCLRQLGTYEADYGIQYGPTPDQWREHIATYSFIPESVLGLPVIESLHFNQLEWPTPLIAGRRGEIQLIVDGLLASGAYPAACLMGVSGIGKTTVLRQVQDIAGVLPQVHGIVDIIGSSQLTRESLLDEILRQLGQDYTSGADLSLRQKHLAHILQSDSYLICLDEYSPNSVNWRMVFDFLIPILGRSRLLCATQEAELRSEVYPIWLTHLTLDEVEQWLSEKYDRPTIVELHRVTRGHPLGLQVLLSFLRINKAALPSLRVEIAGQGHAESAWNEAALFEWVWKQLTPDQITLLLALTVGAVQEGIPAAIIPALLDAPVNEPQKQLAKLADLQLVIRRDPDNQRYFIHNDLKQALQRSVYGTRLAEIQSRFVAYYYDLVAQHKHQFGTLEAHRYNILYALNLGIAASDVRAIGVLLDAYTFLDRSGFYHASIEMLDMALNQTDIPAADCIRLANSAGKLYIKLGRYDTARERFDAALKLAQTHQLTEFNSALYQNLGIIHLEQTQYPQAATCFQLASEWAEHHGQLDQLCKILGNSGTLASRQGHYEESAASYSKCLALAERLRDSWMIEFAQTGLGNALNELGDYAAAHENYQKSRLLLRDLGDPERQAYLMLNLGVLYYTERRYQEAHDVLEEGRVLAARIGHLPLQAQIGWNIGDVLLAQERGYSAEIMLKESLYQAKDCQRDWLITGVLISLGKLSLFFEKWTDAYDIFREALMGSLNHSEFNAQSVYGFALAAAAPKPYIGSEDAALIRSRIETALTELLQARIRQMPITHEQLEAAERFFQQDLRHYPRLHQLDIVPTLVALLSPS